MKSMISRLEAFHSKFGLVIGKPLDMCSEEKQELHYKLMLEELNEFRDACKARNMEKIADGLGDVLFVLMSSVVEHGLQGCFMDIFNEICRSNMSKIGEDGTVMKREDGKVLRPETYSKPDLVGIIDEYRYKMSLSPGDQSVYEHGKIMEAAYKRTLEMGKPVDSTPKTAVESSDFCTCSFGGRTGGFCDECGKPIK